MAVRKKTKKKARSKTKARAKKTKRVKKTKARAKTARKTKKTKKTTKSRKTKTRAKTKTKKTRKKAKRKSTGRKSGLMQMQYHLSAPLAEIVGSKTSTRPQVVKKIWAYIKAKNLQDSKNRRMINPDKKLGAVLGNRQISMLKMAGAISKHLKKA